MKQFTAGKNEQDVRLSRFVLSVTQNLPNSLLHKHFRNKRIKVNGKKGLPDMRLNQGDIIELYINDEFFGLNGKTPKKQDENIQYPPINILYEDDNIMAVVKPVNLLCHSDKSGKISLIDIIQNYLKQKNEYNEKQEHTFAPAICNRLDTNTEGIVLAAKNYAALRDLNFIIKNNLLKKNYKCITFNKPKNGIFKAFLKKNEMQNKVRIKTQEQQGFKEIITGVTVLNTKNELSLCDIELITGRTHQIRAHLAFLGAPVLGDAKYGNKEQNKKHQTTTQALCAYSIEFSENLPNDSVLNYLKGKKMVLQNCSTDKLFESLSFKR